MRQLSLLAMANRAARGGTRRRASRLRLIASCLFLWTLIAVPSARGYAQSSASEPPAYREAIAAALAEFDAGNYLEARRLFTRAHEAFPSARSLRGLSIVSFELHRYGDCIAFGEQALRSEVKPLDAAMRKETEGLVGRSREFVAEVTIQATPRQASLAIDGAEDQSLDASPYLLDIGTHELEFRAAGYASERRTLDVRGGEKRTLIVVLQRLVQQAEPRSPAGPSQASVPPKSWWTLRNLVGGSAVVVGLAAYAVSGVATSKHRDAGSQLRADDPISELY